MNQSESDLLELALNGDKSAINCAKLIISASQTLDDLWDKDKSVSGEMAAGMMLSMSVDLQREPFYRRHQDRMIDIVERAILQWVEANDIEEDAGDLLDVSYIIRSSVTDALIQMTYLQGDRARARAVALSIRRHAFSSNEPIHEYRNEILSSKSEGS